MMSALPNTLDCYLTESVQRRVDELHFVGSQVNALRKLFGQLAADAALEPLEEACC